MAISGVRWRATALVGAVLLLLVTTGCGTRGDGVGGARGATYAGIEEVPEKLSDDGTTILVGSPEAPITLTLFEEPRCPACRDFEVDGAGPDLRDMLVRGRIRIEYTLGSFLDRDGSGGSKRAVNALRAALEKDRFVEFHEALYYFGQAVDAFTVEGLLLTAGQVDGLRGKKFDAAVREMKYEKFVSASERALDAADVDSTPTMLINGGDIESEHYGVLYEPDVIEVYLDLYVRNDGEVSL